jgi:hypothetical protein
MEKLIKTEFTGENVKRILYLAANFALGNLLLGLIWVLVPTLALSAILYEGDWDMVDPKAFCLLKTLFVYAIVATALIMTSLIQSKQRRTYYRLQKKFNTVFGETKTFLEKCKLVFFAFSETIERTAENIKNKSN